MQILLGLIFIIKFVFDHQQKTFDLSNMALKVLSCKNRNVIYEQAFIGLETFAEGYLIVCSL